MSVQVDDQAAATVDKPSAVDKLGIPAEKVINKDASIQVNDRAAATDKPSAPTPSAPTPSAPTPSPPTPSTPTPSAPTPSAPAEKVINRSCDSYKPPNIYKRSVLLSSWHCAKFVSFP